MQQAGPEARLQINNNAPPKWLTALLTEKFFVSCDQHDLNFAKKRKEKNSFCLDCISGVCHNCLSNHSSHQLLQIRRYVYHDVIRLYDIQKLFDCSRVQTYVINSAKVVFLNERPQQKLVSSKTLSNTCLSCDRSLQNAYKFCSVACKVDAVFNKQAGGLFGMGERQHKRLGRSGSESHSSSANELSEAFKHAKKSSDNTVLNLDHHLQFSEEQQQSPTSSEYSSTTDQYEISSWDQYDAAFSPSFLMCHESRAPTTLASDQHPLHCHLQQYPIAKNALSFKISKHLHGIRYQSASPRSVFFPTSLGRRKSRPHRSPLS